MKTKLDPGVFAKVDLTKPEPLTPTEKSFEIVYELARQNARTKREKKAVDVVHDFIVNNIFG